MLIKRDTEYIVKMAVVSAPYTRHTFLISSTNSIRAVDKARELHTPSFGKLKVVYVCKASSLPEVIPSILRKGESHEI